MVRRTYLAVTPKQERLAMSNKRCFETSVHSTTEGAESAGAAVHRAAKLKPKPKYEVIESKLWRRDDGRTASIYGACPWTGTAERSRWQLVTTGWTVRDLRTGTVGIGRVPWKTVEEALAWCAAQMVAEQERPQHRSEDGKYDYDGKLERMCVCGCPLGAHSATVPHECLAYSQAKGGSDYKDCRCPKFRQSRKIV